MGIEIELSGSGFDQFKWRRELGDVAFTEGTEPQLSPLVAHLFDPEDPGLVLYDEEGDRAAAADAELWLLPAGGIRGVTIKNSPPGIILSMPLGTGTRDWELAEILTKLGTACGASVEVDGEPVTADLDFGELATKSWQMTIATFSQILAKGEHTASLPVLGQHLQLEITSSNIESPSLHDDLVARMNRCGEAHLSSDMTIEKAGAPMVVNIAGGVPTLIKKDVDGIILWDAPDNPLLNDGPLFDAAPVPMAKYLELMGDRVESFGEGALVPLVKYSEIPELFEALKTAAAEADFSQAGGGDYNALAHGPVLIFLLVAGADGTVDKKEAATFQALLANSEHAPGELFQQMLRDSRDNFQQVITEITSQGKPPQLVLVEFLKTLDQYPPDEALLARQGLYALGHTVASASGGFLGFGSKISKSEKNALEMLRTMLGVDPDDFLSR